MHYNLLENKMTGLDSLVSVELASLMYAGIAPRFNDTITHALHAPLYATTTKGHQLEMALTTSTFTPL